MNAQDLLEEHKKQQAIADYYNNKKQRRLRQLPSQINSISKNLYNGGQGLAGLGNKLASSDKPVLQSLGSGLQKMGGGMQTASGRPFANDMTAKAGEMLSNKLAFGASQAAPASSAITDSISSVAPSASAITGAADTASNIGNAAGSVGSAVGNVAPVVSGVTGALNVGSDLQKGDYTNAGLDTAKTAATLAGGPIGAALAAGIQLYQMFDGAQKKKQAKAMQASMEEINKNQQINADKKAQLMNEYDQATANNLQEINNNNDNTSIKDKLLSMFKQQATPDETMTGAAAPAPIVDDNGVVDADYQQDPNQVFMENVTVPQQDNSSIKEKLMNGLKDIYAGYQDNSQNSFLEGDMFRQFNPQEVEPQQMLNDTLAKYQDQLRGQGYNEDVVNAVAEGKNSGYKDIDEWIKANPEAFEQQGVLTGGASKTQPKSGWQRFGEALGTAQRLASNPILQGLVAGAAYGKSKNDALYGLGKGVEWAQNKSKSNFYSDQLGQPRTVFGSFDDKDYNTRINADYKNATLQNAQQRLENDKAYRDAMIEQRKFDAEEKRRHNEVQEGIARDRNNAIRARANSRGSSASQKYDPTSVPGFYDDYADFEESEAIFNDENLYEQEVQDMLDAMNQGKGWFDKKATRAEAEAKINSLHRKEKNDFYKKYKLNPMKDKLGSTKGKSK